MFRLFIVCLVVVLSFSQLKAKDDHQVSLKLGLTSIDNEDGWSFEKGTFFTDLTFDTHTIIKPRIDLGYINIDEVDSGGVGSLMQLAFNGIYEIDLSEYNSAFKPYLLGGVGYEHVFDSIPEFESHPFYQAGFGAGYLLNDRITLVSEFRALQMIDSSKDDENNEFVFMLGVSMPLFVDVIQSKIEKTPKPKPIRQLPAPEIVQNVQPLFLDTDGDGVEDADDKCKYTQIGAKVDKQGCTIVEPIVIPEEVVYIKEPRAIVNTPVVQKKPKVKPKKNRRNLEINFESNSAVIMSDSKLKIKRFANYLKKNPKATVTIEGYTDNSGIRSKNLALSKKRAKAVASLLVKYGVKASKIKAVGKGDLNPIADNETELGRAKNRRIEAVMHY